mgnify:CR=1 FL=1
MTDRKFTIEDLKRAFEAGRLTHIQTSNPYHIDIKYTRQYASFEEYIKTLQVEEPEFEEFNPKTHTMNPETLIALEDGRTVPFRVLLQAFNSLELERYEEANYGSNRPYNFDEPTDEPVPKALVEEVQKMLDDCQKNWKAATEASIESIEQRIVNRIVEAARWADDVVLEDFADKLEGKE